jgi:protocatechuate 3,4-dioxygenase beta subunit
MRIRSAVIVALLLSTVAPLHATIRGVVMTFEGKPIAGARAVAYPAETWTAFRERFVSQKPERVPIAEATSDAKGAFSVDAGKSGSFDFVLEAPGFAPVEVRALADFDLGATPLREAPLKTGRVTAGGKPVAGARLVWNGTDGMYVTLSDEEGRYRVPDPATFPAFLMMWHPDFAIVFEQPLRRSTKRSLDIAAKPGIAVRGRVVGADRKSGVAGATVYVDGWPLAKSGDDGAFEIPHASESWMEISAATAGRFGIRTRGVEGDVVVVLSTPASVAGLVIDSRTALPVAGAEIIARISAANAYSDPATFTDAKGGFRFAAIPAGTYSLAVRHPDYVATPIVITVRAGERLTKNLPIRPLAQVSGSVLNEDKQPVAAAGLVFERVRDWIAGPMNRAQLQYSGPDGRFVMHDMPVELDGQIAAEKPGAPQATSDAFRLAPAEHKGGVVLTIPRGLEVNGRVVDGDGRGIIGAGVDFSAAQDDGSRVAFISGADDPPAVRSGSDGSFSARLKKGQYNFMFRAPGFAPRRVSAVAVEPGMKPLEVTLDPGVEITGRVVRSDGAGVEGARVTGYGATTASTRTMTLSDGGFVLSDLEPGPTNVVAFIEGAPQPARQGVTAPARDIVIEIPRGGTIRGRVTDKSTGGPVVDFQLTVSEIRSSDGILIPGAGLRRQFHADDGAFVVESVPVGPVDISVVAAGFSRKRVAGLRVEESKPLVDVELALEAGSRLVGRVTAPDGSPIEGAGVMRAVESAGTLPRGAQDWPRAQTDGNGDYAIESLELGEQRFMIGKSGYLTETRTVNLAGREARLEVRLSRGLTLTGTVRSAAGVPIAGAAIDASSAAVDSNQGRGATDAQGNFRIEGVAPGRYEIAARKSGFSKRTLRDVDVETAGHLRITLDSGGVIHGTVRGLPPEELAAVNVNAFSADGHAGASADANGNYRIESVAAGSVRVNANAQTSSGYRSSSTKNVEVTSGGEQEVDIEFSSDTTIQGRVTRFGRPETNATVRFLPASAATQTSASGFVDQNGSYTVSGLEDGEYNVSVVNMSRRTPYSMKYEVRGSGTFDIDMRGGTLRGRVVEAATGEGIVEASVTLQPLQIEGDSLLHALNAATDTAGEFSIEMIAPGRYSARAQKSERGHHTLDVTIDDTDSNFVELKLAKEAGLTIRPIDGRSGRALEAGVTVRDTADRVVYETFWRVSSGGIVHIPVSAGSYRVRIASDGYAARVIHAQAPSQEIRVAMTPGGSLVIDSSRGARVSVRLIDATGSDYTAGLYYMGTMPLSPGKNTLSNVAPGSYTLQVLDAAGAVEKSVTVTVQEGQVANVAI